MRSQLSHVSRREGQNNQGSSLNSGAYSELCNMGERLLLVVIYYCSSNCVHFYCTFTICGIGYSLPYILQQEEASRLVGDGLMMEGAQGGGEGEGQEGVGLGEREIGGGEGREGEVEGGAVRQMRVKTVSPYPLLALKLAES